MDSDIISKTKDIEVHQYLDIIRGATYSVLLAIILAGIIQSNARLRAAWPFAVIIIIFFVLDGVARFIGRAIMRFDYVGTIAPYKEVKCLLLELVGLFFFSYWAYNLLLNINGSNFGVFFGFFTVSTAIHNAIMIEIDKGRSFHSFFVEAITKDGSAIDRISNRWEALVLNAWTKRFQKYKEKFDAHSEKTKTGKTSESSTIARSSGAFLKSYRKASFFWGCLHLLAQLIALHFFHFNLIAGILIIFSDRFKNIRISNSFATGITITALVFFVVSVYSYYKTSSLEFDRMDATGRRYGFPTKKEKGWQFVGNIALIMVMMIAYFNMAHHGLLVVFIFGEQLLIGVTAIFGAKRSQEL